MKKFSKLFGVLVLSFGVSVASYGKTVNESVAKNTGANFLVSNGVSGVQTASDLVTAYVATATVGGVPVTDYYVFNFASGAGFIMVSGDDRIQPILAYSGDASFDINAMSPDAKWWIEGYQNQISWVIEHDQVSDDQKDAATKWTELQTAYVLKSGARTTSSFPSSSTYLLTTLWDQAPNYNYLCPGGSPTGCVATAMAQIMKYNAWPTVGTGYHSYTSTTNHYNLNADFGNTAYGWSSMGNNITTSNKPYIGRLMFQCGVSVNMDYTSLESGAYTISLVASQIPTIYCAEYAFKTFFHYKSSLQGLARDGGPGGNPAPISTGSWISTLKAEMDANRPVLYSGSSTTAGGHAWVCDGYDGSNNMHFNWGWSGTGPNGWYSVNSIAPPALGVGGGGGNFNNGQDIIIGIVPQPYPANGSGTIKMLSHVDCQSNSPINYMSGFTVTAKILNSAASTFSGDFCAQIFDQSSNYEGTIQTITGKTINAGDSTASLTFTTGGLAGMIPGLNGIRIMYRATGTSTWQPVADNGTFINYNALAVTNSQGVELNDSIHVGPHMINRGSSLNINTKLSNIGSGDFNGTVQAVLVNVSTGASYPVQALTGQSIPLYSSKSYAFTNSSIMAPSGTYVLTIQHQPGGSGTPITTGSNYYQNPILFNILSTTSIEEVNNLSDNIVVFPNPATNVINVSLNGATVNSIRVMDIQGRLVSDIAPDNNQQVISIPVSNYAGGVYFVQLQCGSNMITKKIVITK